MSDALPCDEVFVVGRVEPAGSDKNWNLVGFFDVRSAAEGRCVNGNYFVGRGLMNQPLTEEFWDGVYWPKKW